ncbi:extracellular solute-binding protein [Paenibacillus koleovorans]|uniref:extracellular solute-binding protein n=1 Tax=Paenibacillus koleovorans TaxID=121608 RepID=UPI000FD7F655|nr:extracellular solute-binding protein [Paenibacillus koleovorans]
MSHIKRGAALLVACMVVIAGCSKSENASETGSPQPTSSTAAPSKPPLETLSVMIPLFVQEAPNASTDTMKKIEEYTGQKTDIQFIPSGAYDDKVNVAIASQTTPHSFLIQDAKSPAYLNAVRSGMFWEIGPYLKEFKNLSKLSPDLAKNVSIDGKLYGIPRVREATNVGVNFRKDWLENLGLTMPSTPDQLYEAIKAFTLQDPDQNKKNDTVGLIEYGSIAGFSQVVLWYGGPNKWGVQNDKIVPDFYHDSYFKAMDWYKRLYQEKLMNQDFSALKVEQQRELFNQQKGGIYLGGVSSTYSQTNPLNALMYQEKYKNAEGVKSQDDLFSKLYNFTAIKGTSGEIRLPGELGYFGQFVFPKTSLKTEAELKQALSFFDKLQDEPMVVLTTWGILGKHSIDHGNKIYEMVVDNNVRNKDINSLSQLSVSITNAQYKGEAKGLNPYLVRVRAYPEEFGKYAVSDPTMPFLSETLSKNPGLDSIVSDARVKYVMGLISLDDFKKEVKRWENEGGLKIIDEFTKQYLKSKG